MPKMLQNSLRNIIVTTSLLLPIVPLTAQEALVHHLDFQVHNQTSFPIVELYVSNSGHRTWEENVLAGDLLTPGDSSWIRFSGNHDGCLFDLLAVFSDGEQVVDPRVNLCEVSDITFQE